MKTLKTKFGKFSLTQNDLRAIKGGHKHHCPQHLREPGGCEKYWGDDLNGRARCLKHCILTTKHNEKGKKGLLEGES